MTKTVEQNIRSKLEILSSVRSVFDDSEKTHCQYIDLQKKIEDQIQDLLHEIEFGNFYRTEGHRKARQLKDLRQKRRYVKNYLEANYNIKEFGKNHKKLLSEIEELIKQLERILATQNNRTYACRSNEDGKNINKHFSIQAFDFSEDLKIIEKERQAKREKYLN